MRGCSEGGRYGVEMEGGQFRSEHSRSEGSEVRTGRACLEKDKQMRQTDAGAPMCDVEGAGMIWWERLEGNKVGALGLSGERFGGCLICRLLTLW